MLSELLAELQELFWGLGLICGVILLLWMMPKSYSLKLGEHPLLLLSMFTIIMVVIINIFI
ncbi:MAG: hypothetical protein ABS12_04905 [SAR86 cluster bacterium BACL1 MAG-121004-bin11]|nr:MAG: hypothetical protein ABS12_04905 [SAR86 cluster bacterium BACL1 MAG-121004-bin11]